MAANDWSVEFNDVDHLIQKIEQIPNRSESILNNTLRSKSAPMAINSIQPDIPISSWKGRVLKKKHARNYNSLTVKHGNLEFTIRPKPSFNYIKYPDLGIGTSKNNEPKQFMKKGLDQAVPGIMSDLTNAVMEEINRTLGE